MGRNVVKRELTKTDKPGATLEDGSPVDKAPMQGGSSGAPPDPNPRSALVHGIADIAPARDVVVDETEEIDRNATARRFEVVGGPSEVMYEGGRVTMRLGKVYSENAADLDLLRKQGVQFKALDPEPPVVTRGEEVLVTEAP